MVQKSANIMSHMKYVKYSAVFTVMHKLPQMLAGGKILEHDPETGTSTTRPLLLGDKIAIVGASALLSQGLAPYLMWQDLNKVDILWRGGVSRVNSGNTARRSLIQYIL